jgi:hypothetical protein
MIVEFNPLTNNKEAFVAKIKTIVIVALLAISVNGQFVKFQNTMSAGLALAVGEGAEGMHPGINFCIEPVGRINKYFGLGGHIDYTWLSADIPSGFDERAGLHLWDASLVPKLFVPIVERLDFFCDIDPGVSFVLAYDRYMGQSATAFKTGFSMTYQAGFDINQFVIGFKIKNSFIQGGHSSWVNFNIGFTM